MTELTLLEHCEKYLDNIKVHSRWAALDLLKQARHEDVQLARDLIRIPSWDTGLRELADDVCDRLARTDRVIKELETDGPTEKAGD